MSVTKSTSITSARITSSTLPSFCSVFDDDDTKYPEIFAHLLVSVAFFSLSLCFLDSVCLLQSSAPPWAIENSESQTVQKHELADFFPAVNVGNLLLYSSLNDCCLLCFLGGVFCLSSSSLMFDFRFVGPIVAENSAESEVLFDSACSNFDYIQSAWAL